MEACKSVGKIAPVVPPVPGREKPALFVPNFPRKDAQLLVFLPAAGSKGTSAKPVPAVHVQQRELCELSTRQQWRWMRLWENAVRFR